LYIKIEDGVDIAFKLWKYFTLKKLQEESLLEIDLCKGLALKKVKNNDT